MQYRVNPKNGDKLSALGQGCMRLPTRMGMVDKEKAEKLYLSAIESGINYFDTAYIYPGSEQLLGDILAKNNVRDKVFLATKLPQSACKTADDFDKFFASHLARLQTDYIDYYLLHNIVSLDQWERLKALGIKDWIERKKQEGSIKNIGFSYHGNRHDFPKLIDEYDWDFVQIQYNYLNVNYQAGKDGLEYAHKKNLPVIIMEPLLGGRLAVGLPKKAKAIINKTGKTAAEIALGWLFDSPAVTVVLSGMRELSELNSNVETASSATAGGFTQHDAVEKVIKVMDDCYKIMCTGCNYCMPCSKKINIPACFTAYNASFAMGWYTGIKLYMIAAGMVGDTPAYAGDCSSCKKCEKHCPQGIEISKQLKKVKRKFENPFTLLCARFIKWFLHKDKKKRKN